MKLIKTILRSRTTETIKIKYIIIVLGATLAFIAPFVHMVFPKVNPEIVKLDLQLKNGDINKSEYSDKVDNNRFFGFKTKRKFWYAVGKPIAMLCFALIMFSVMNYINEPIIKKAIRNSCLLFTSISSYFIIWVLWDRQDFPKPFYYSFMAVISIASTYVFYVLIGKQLSLRKIYFDNIRRLTRFIVVDVRDKYVKESDNTEFTKDIIRITDSLE